MSPCLLVFLLLPGVWKERPDSEKLLSEGHRAFARGDFAGAAALYEQAEMRSTDPARVAYFLAGAKYRLAMKTEGPSLELQEAEQWYRCCLDSVDPHRPGALYGLGNCLLHKAGAHDAASLRAAVACYDQCLQSAGDAETLKANARYNRERARLMLLQFPPQLNGPQSEGSPRDETNPPPPQSDPLQPTPASIEDNGSEGNPDAHTVEGDPKAEQGSTAAKTNDPPAPGKGNMEPIPDEVDVPPLSPHVAAEHLELATKKVLLERQMHHRRVERASATGVKDW